jgi:hypothetical protein
MSDLEAYAAGWRAAACLMKEMLEPQLPDWHDYAPAWARERTIASYQWQHGFVWGWNCLAKQRGWTLQLPHRYTTPAL